MAVGAVAVRRPKQAANQQLRLQLLSPLPDPEQPPLMHHPLLPHPPMLPRLLVWLLLLLLRLALLRSEVREVLLGLLEVVGVSVERH